MAAALPAIALAALWSLSVSPSTVTQGQFITFTLTVTNHDTTSNIGCLDIDLAPSFVIASVSDPNPSNGSDWSSNLSGHNILAYSLSGIGRLNSGESVTITVIARGTAAGSYSWPNHAHTSQNCNGTNLTGPSIVITVQPSGPNPTPLPTPVPTPIVAPSSAPKPGSTATPRPSAAPLSTPAPNASTPSSASPTPDGSSSAGPLTPAPGPTSGGTGSGGQDGMRLAPLSGSADGSADDFGSGLDILALLDGPFVWFVPGAAVGVPGLLVIAFVVLQGIGAMAWIPATRRLSGDDQPARRRPLRPA